MKQEHKCTHHKLSTTRVLSFSILIILFFAIFETVGAYISNSLALWSDAIHMFADFASLVLALMAALIAKKSPSKKLSYGYGRAEIIGASISSLMLIITVIFIIIEAIERLYVPEDIHVNSLLIISTIGLISNILVIKILHAGEKNLNSRAAILHVIGDLLGSVAAIIAGIIIKFTAWTPIDSILSFFISILILISSVSLLKEGLSVLMESVPKNINIEEIRQKLLNLEHIIDLHDLHVWSVASGKILLTTHLVVTDFAKWHQTLKDAHILLKNNFNITHITLQAELSCCNKNNNCYICEKQ